MISELVPVATRTADDAGTTGETAEERRLWERYQQSGDLAARDELVSRFWWIVEQEARRFLARNSGTAELDDLVSAGALGLLQAVERFDRSRGFVFPTYARPRIRGAIHDEWRRRDWMPRLARRRARHLRQAEAKVESRIGRRAAEVEVAAELSVDLPTLWQWQSQAARGSVALEGLVTQTPDEGRQEVVLPDAGPAPDASLLACEQLARLRAALGCLPERERQVLALAYFEELSGNEIATVLGVSASRVSQLRSRAIARLQAVLRPEEFA